ncbi:MAG: hypothetical protein OCD02_05395 [Spirochaetaceae bacterium]
MNKLFKFLTILAVMAFFASCDLTLIEDYTLEITNETGYTIYYLYVVPADDYVALSSSWSTYYSYYNTNYTNVLGSSSLYNNSYVTIDLTDYSGTDFVIVAFDSSDVYKIDVDTYTSYDSIYYPEDALF